MIALKTDVVKHLESIWKIHTRRALTFKMGMGFDSTNSFRTFCSKGFMNALLFKNEIELAYEMTKCSLTDGDLRDIRMAETVGENDKIGIQSVKDLIKKQHESILRPYNKLLKELELQNEVSTLLKDHIAKLKDLMSLLETDKLKVVITS